MWHFCTFWAFWGYFGVRVKFKNFWGPYLHKLSTFVLKYSSILLLLGWEGGLGWLSIAILMKTKFDFDFDWRLWVCQQCLCKPIDLMLRQYKIKRNSDKRESDKLQKKKEKSANRTPCIYNKIQMLQNCKHNISQCNFIQVSTSLQIQLNSNTMNCKHNKV